MPLFSTLKVAIQGHKAYQLQFCTRDFHNLKGHGSILIFSWLVDFSKPRNYYPEKFALYGILRFLP